MATPQILKDGVVPRALIYGSPLTAARCADLSVPHGAYANVCGTDLIRDEDGDFVGAGGQSARALRRLLHAGQPRVARRAFPGTFRTTGVRPIERYPLLLATLRALAPFHADVPIVVLTPGVYNSAYFEHAYLARLMGVPLVEGRDLVVHDNIVYMRTTTGLRRVDVIYRRVDDDFIDPLTFRRDSALGVAGLFNAYRAGNVVICQRARHRRRRRQGGLRLCAATHPLLPGRGAILPNVETFLCREPAQLSHVLANLDKLVVKAVGASGGYGMLVGPHATQAERDEFAETLKADPGQLHRPADHPALHRALPGRRRDRAAARRPAPLHPARREDRGDARRADPRGAASAARLVVNSSQGGGSKDTWVLAE